MTAREARGLGAIRDCSGLAMSCGLLILQDQGRASCAVSHGSRGATGGVSQGEELSVRDTCEVGEQPFSPPALCYLCVTLERILEARNYPNI
jgi:hypothetical protein